MNTLTADEARPLVRALLRKTNERRIRWKAIPREQLYLNVIPGNDRGFQAELGHLGTAKLIRRCKPGTRELKGITLEVIGQGIEAFAADLGGDTEGEALFMAADSSGGRSDRALLGRAYLLETVRQVAEGVERL
jgi:hypothetical protein